MALKTSCAAVLAVLALTGSAAAEPPDISNGRYTMSPVDGGFLRLDKQTGAVAMCARSAGDWACNPVQDHTAAAPSNELSKLEEENEALKDRIKALQESLEAGKPALRRAVVRTRVLRVAKCNCRPTKRSIRLSTTWSASIKSSATASKIWTSQRRRPCRPPTTARSLAKARSRFEKLHSARPQRSVAKSSGGVAGRRELPRRADEFVHDTGFRHRVARIGDDAQF